MARRPLESLLVELQAQLLAGQHGVQDALLELHAGRAAAGGAASSSGGPAPIRAGAGDDCVTCAVGAEAHAAGVPASTGCLLRPPLGDLSLARVAGSAASAADEYDMLRTPQHSSAFATWADEDEVVMQTEAPAAAAGVSPEAAAPQAAEASPQPRRDRAPGDAHPQPGAARLFRSSSGASSMRSSQTADSSRMYSAASQATRHVSMEPRQSARGATSAMDMIGHDSVRSYDLKELWRSIFPSEVSAQSGVRRGLVKMISLATLQSEPSRLRRSARKLVQTTGYELTVMFVIVLNSIFLGWQVQYEASHRRQPPYNTELEALFCVVFTAELCVKMYAWGVDFLLGVERSWNIFDTAVVLLMIVDFGVQESQPKDDMSGIWSQVSGLRIFRAVRVVRVLRAVRMLQLFSQLRIMIRSIMFSVRPLLWASLVLTAMFYVFGICITQGVVDHFRANDAWDDKSYAGLKHSFGTLERSVLSLFETMSGGVNWGELFDTLSPLPFQFQCVFIFFVLFALFGAANVVTGIFVEIANHWAQYDTHTQIQAEIENKVFYIKALQELFNELDKSGSGKLTLEGMQEAICDQRLVNSFHALHLELMDVRTLFLLLDRDRKGHIDTEEFLLGCFRLKGEAKTLDLMKLQYQSEWVMHNLVKICDVMDSMNVKVTKMSDQLGRVLPADAQHVGSEAGAVAVRAKKSIYRTLSAQTVREQWEQVVGSQPTDRSFQNESLARSLSRQYRKI